MPAGVGFGALYGLVREARSLEQRPGTIVVSGGGVDDLVQALLAGGGDPGAVGLGAAPAAVVVVALAAPPDATARALMRQAARSGVPVVVVRLSGFAGRVPYALPGDVIDSPGSEVPVDDVVAAIVSALADADAVSLARRLPALRELVEQRLIGRTALVNALIGAAPWVREAHLPLMTLAQGRMLLGLGTSEGTVLAHDPQQLAAAAAPPLAASLVAGVGLRELYRRLPVRGPLIAALLAYAGTRALGEAGRRFLRAG
jgi:uncharacterized protein (DUF697 family)